MQSKRTERLIPSIPGEPNAKIITATEYFKTGKTSLMETQREIKHENRIKTKVGDPGIFLGLLQAVVPLEFTAHKPIHMCRRSKTIRTRITKRTWSVS